MVEYRIILAKLLFNFPALISLEEQMQVGRGKKNYLYTPWAYVTAWTCLPCCIQMTEAIKGEKCTLSGRKAHCCVPIYAARGDRNVQYLINLLWLYALLGLKWSIFEQLVCFIAFTNLPPTGKGKYN